MGSLLAKAFIEPTDLLGCNGPDGVCDPPSLHGDWWWGMIQVLTLMGMYGYVLFYASNLLSDGSELLLLVPAIAGSEPPPCPSSRARRLHTVQKRVNCLRMFDRTRRTPC